MRPQNNRPLLTPGLRHRAQAKLCLADSKSPATYTSDRYERQARDIAQRWKQQRDPMVSQRFLPASAARYHLPDSAGEALPTLLKNRFEHDFNADFSVVRIHRDEPSAQQAEQLYAKAFTAGSHIYFASGYYRPDTIEGGQLLAHELVHVLQQTGRAASAGKIRATSITGQGEPQRDAFYNELVAAYQQRAEQDVAGETTTRQQRIQALESAISIINEGIGLRAELTTAAGEHPTIVALEQLILGVGEHPELAARLDMHSSVVRGFIFDCLKMLGRFQGAAKIIDDDPQLICRLRSANNESRQLEEFLEFLIDDENYGRSWFYEIIESIYGAREFPYNLLQGLWEYLVRPELGAEYTHGYSDVYNTYFSGADAEDFAGNERVYAAHAIVRDLDQRVRGWQETLESAYARHGPSARKQYAAEHIVEIGRAMHEGNTVELNYADNNLSLIRHAGNEHLASLGRDIRRLGEAATAYWERVNLLHQISVGNAEIESDMTPCSETVFEDFVTTVEQQAEQLFGGDAIPTMEDYAAAISTFRSALQDHLEPLSHRLQWNIFRYEHRDSETRRSNAAWLGWGLVWIYDFSRNILGRYHTEQDIAAERPDYRLSHRLLVALLLHRFAELAARDELSELTENILRGVDRGESYLLITGEFEEERNVPLERLDDDFDGIIRGLGLTAGQLVGLYGVLYLNAFNTNLIEGLRDYEGNIGSGRQTLVDDAVRTARREVPRPTRWYVPSSDYEIVYFRTGQEQLPDHTLKQLMEAHPVFQQFTAAHSNGDIIVPWGYGRRLYAWCLPPLANIIELLRSFHTLNRRVIDLAGLPETITDRGWFDAFVHIMESGLDGDGRNAEQQQQYDELHGLLHGGMDSARHSANTRRAYVLRRATTRLRRVLAEELNDQLHTYNENRGIREYTIPNDVLRNINDFVDLRWDADMAAQEAALILALAEKLEALFIEDTWLGTIREDRYDLVTGYYGMIERAIDLAENHADQVRAVLFLEENLEPEDRRFHRDIGSAYENPSALFGGVEHLRAVKTSLDTVIADVQRRFGFECNGNILRSLNFAHEFNIGEVMSIVGHDYRITHVYRNFRFHPAYGVGSDAEAPAIVTQLNGNPLPANIQILRYSTDTGDEITLRNRPEDMPQLRQLDEIISTAAFIASLDNLEAAIEQAIETGLDLAELIPGFGQGVMVARILFSLGEFVARDLPDIRERLFENPQYIIDRLTELLGDALETAAPRFLEYMLFGELPFESRLVAPEVDEEEHTPSRRRLQRLFHFVTEMCEDALRAFVRLRGRMRGAFVQAQGRIVSSRALLMLVDAIPQLLQLAEVARDAYVASEALDLTNPETLRRHLSEEVQSIVNSMMRVEIPHDIIPMNVAVEVILGFAIGKFGRKGKVIKEILEVTNTLGEASDLIAEGLTSAGLDPNIPWRTHIRAKLQPLLEHAQRNLYREIAELVSTATNSAIELEEPELAEADVQFDEFDEDSLTLEPFAIDGDVDEETFTNVGSDRGQPLAPDLLGRFASEYGHDFSHVRLHRDTRAVEITESANAYALTGGSHIYLSHRTNLDSADGQQILRHELAHVLQQTGPRPRDRDHGSQPINGEKGGGIRYEASRENAADRMAARAEGSDWEEIIAIEGAGGGYYWMPSMTSFATMLIGNLTDQDVAESQADAFEERVPRSIASKATFLDAVRDARDIWRDVKRNMGSTTESSYRQPLNQNKQRIQTYMDTFSSETLNRYIPGIVLRSIQTRANGRVRLLPRLFANNLETYLFARTGLAINIDMDGSRAGHISVRYLHLANLSANSGIWQDMKSNSMDFIRSNRANRVELFNSANSWRQIRHFIATRLNNHPVWDNDEFRLSAAFIDEVATILLNIGEVQVGTWSEYKSTDQVSSQHAGLRVSTHGALTGGRMPQGARNDRQSHHIPQYLLVEYFRNDNGRLFSGGRDSPERIPGFYPLTRSNELESFKANGSTVSIDLQALDPSAGRGDELPAISLAAVTHQRGRLHMNAASNWGVDDELEGQGTQSDQIDREFIRNIHSQQITGSKEDIAATGQALTGSDLNHYRGKILTAMKDTYASMYDIMMAALPNALVRYEIPYYNGVAMAQHNVDDEDALPPGYRAPETTAEIQSVVEAMRTKNSEIMRQWR